MKRALAPLLLLLCWTLASLLFANARALPGPLAVVRAAAQEMPRAALWTDLGATLLRLCAGVAIAVVAGGAAGFWLGATRRGWRAAEPTVDFLRAIPPILTFPVFLLALGYGESARIAAVAAGASLIIAFQVGGALARIPAERADAVRLAGLRGVRALLHLQLYEALPALFNGIRLALAAGLIIAVVSEMLIGAAHGLGARALSAQVAYRSDVLWLIMILAGAVGMALSAAVAALERRLIDWQ